MAGPIDHDAALMELAGRRGGICTRADLLAHGLSRGAIDRRIKIGLLEPLCRGVYGVAQLADGSTPLHRAAISVPQSVIFREAAGHVLSFPTMPTRPAIPVDVVTPIRIGRHIDGVRIHFTRRPLPDSDVIDVDGLPVTSPARTIVDLAAVVGPGRLRYIIQTQVRDNNPTPEALLACFDSVARRGVTGIARLRRILMDMFDDEPLPLSALEERLSGLLRANGIAGFEPQFRPPWFDGRRGTVDFAHPELRIVLEADGRRWHQREQDMTNDRQRDRRAAAHGWVTVRVTWAEITQRPAAVIQDLLAVMSARRSIPGAA